MNPKIGNAFVYWPKFDEPKLLVQERVSGWNLKDRLLVNPWVLGRMLIRPVGGGQGWNKLRRVGPLPVGAICGQNGSRSWYIRQLHLFIYLFIFMILKNLYHNFFLFNPFLTHWKGEEIAFSLLYLQIIFHTGRRYRDCSVMFLIFGIGIRIKKHIFLCLNKI